MNKKTKKKNEKYAHVSQCGSGKKHVNVYVWVENMKKKKNNIVLVLCSGSEALGLSQKQNHDLKSWNTDEYRQAAKAFHNLFFHWISWVYKWMKLRARERWDRTPTRRWTFYLCMLMLQFPVEGAPHTGSAV